MVYNKLIDAETGIINLNGIYIAESNNHLKKYCSFYIE